MKRNPFGRGAAMFLAISALGGANSSMVKFFEEPPVPTEPNEAELEWLGSLNSFRRDQWRRRFNAGLTREQRAYVDEQVRPKDILVSVDHGKPGGDYTAELGYRREPDGTIVVVSRRITHPEEDLK